MHASGTQSIAIKTYDGGQTFTQPFTIPDMREALNELGPVVVGAWGYHYGYDMDAEIAQVEHALHRLQADFVILNVEDPAIERDPDTAEKWDAELAGLRQRWPNASLYFCSHAQPAYHERQPYWQATQHGLIHQPMIYHTAMQRTPAQAVDVSMGQYAEYGLIAVDDNDVEFDWSAAGGCYDTPGWPIRPDEIIAWADAVNSWGASSHIWWDAHAVMDRPDLMAAIRASAPPMGKEKDSPCD